MKKFFISFILVLAWLTTSSATTLKEIKANGVLRHLGVYYANFNTGSGDGYDTEIMKMFAKHLGVRYQHVKTTFATVITDLSGIKVKSRGSEVDILGITKPKGDIIANGLTILPWRQKVVDFSTPTFPTQVWLLARADSPMNPVQPTGNPDNDIHAVKAMLKNKTVLEKKNTCLDAELYQIADVGAIVKSFSGGLADMAPAIIQGEAECTILDVPDALVALEEWGDKVKVIGPVSKFQGMGVGFTKDAPLLKKAFNDFLKKIKNDGTLYKLVNKYYSLAFQFYPDFFSDLKQ
jgi:ABC-type amino acid transport substrate-binding protein